MTKLMVLVSIVLPVQSPLIAAESQASDEESLFITEAYYQIEWGHLDEFTELFKRNHFPILTELKKRGISNRSSLQLPWVMRAKDRVGTFACGSRRVTPTGWRESSQRCPGSSSRIRRNSRKMSAAGSDS